MALHDDIWELREERIEKNIPVVPEAPQGVTKDRIREVLGKLDLNESGIVDVVFALLDDREPSWFSKPPDEATFSDGASTAHIFCHVGILQRANGKLDREGRDYFIKPLRKVGAVEACYLNPDNRKFVYGHPVPKSSNSAYRLDDDFVEILKAPDDEWEDALEKWASEDSIRKRMTFQASMAKKAARRVDTKHQDLIDSSVDNYAPKFLKGYQVLYVDSTDGDRITAEDRELLEEAGLSLELGDAMPDVLLWNDETDWLWVIEAVTSDGEVDLHKRKRLTEFAERHGKAGIGFTTTYQTWKRAGRRQAKTNNIAPETFIWIEESPTIHLHVKAYDS
jgi:hypothetical protein